MHSKTNGRKPESTSVQKAPKGKRVYFQKSQTKAIINTETEKKTRLQRATKQLLAVDDWMKGSDNSPLGKVMMLGKVCQVPSQ